MKRAPSGTDSNLLAPPRKAIQTFELPYSESAVRDLREGLARTRWPGTIPGSGWEFGFDLECLQPICRYWREKFDRKAEVEKLGDLHHLQFRTGEQSIQFVHERGKRPAAIPILLLRVLPVVSGGAEHRKPDWPLPSEEVRAVKIAGLRIENGNSCCDNSSETSPRRYRRKNHAR